MTDPNEDERLLGDPPEPPDHVWTAALDHAFDPWAEPDSALLPTDDPAWSSTDVVDDPAVADDDDPLGHEHDPLGHDTLGHDSYDHDTLGHDTLGHDPLDHDPLGHASYDEGTPGYHDDPGYHDPGFQDDLGFPSTDDYL